MKMGSDHSANDGKKRNGQRIVRQEAHLGILKFWSPLEPDDP
jgi:hypothetical protein